MFCMAKKTYNERLNSSNKAEVKIVPPEAAIRYGGSKMLIATPLEYDAVMKRVPKGRIITSDIINTHLAKKYNADWTCPLTCGIFINTAAHASAERNGKDETPYWRTVKKAGELNEKFPGGLEGHKAKLQDEGHTIIQKGKRLFVKDFEKALHKVD